MSDRVNDLANRLEATADAITSTVEGLNDEQWRSVATADGRQINVLVDHIAVSHPSVLGLAEMILNGQELPGLTADAINHSNADHMVANAGVGKSETLAKLRKNTKEAAAKIRTWTDSDLDKAQAWNLSESGELTPEAVVEYIMIGHALDHLNSITAAVNPD